MTPKQHETILDLGLKTEMLEIDGTNYCYFVLERSGVHSLMEEIAIHADGSIFLRNYYGKVFSKTISLREALKLIKLKNFR